MSIVGNGINIDDGGSKIFGADDTSVDTGRQMADTPQLGFASIYMASLPTTFFQNTENVADFNGEVSDIDGWHDNVTNNSRLTVPAKWNGYVVMLGARVALNVQASNAVQGFIKHYNSSDVLQAMVGRRHLISGDSASNDLVYAFHSYPVEVATGDYFELSVINRNSDAISDSGTDGTAFWVEVLGKAS